MISCWEPSSPCSAWAPRPGVPPGAAATSQPPPPRPKRCCGGSARTWWNREETNGNPQGLGFFRFSRFFSHETVRFFVSMKPSWGFPYGTIGEHLDATKNLVWPVKPLGFSIEKHGGFNRISNTQNEETSGKIIGKNHQQIGFHHEASMKSYELFLMRGYTQKKSGFFYWETTTMKKCLQQKYRVEARAWNWDPDFCGPNNCGWILMLAASLLESPTP